MTESEEINKKTKNSFEESLRTADSNTNQGINK